MGDGSGIDELISVTCGVVILSCGDGSVACSFAVGGQQVCQIVVIGIACSITIVGIVTAIIVDVIGVGFTGNVSAVIVGVGIFLKCFGRTGRIYAGGETACILGFADRDPFPVLFLIS